MKGVTLAGIAFPAVVPGSVVPGSVAWRTVVALVLALFAMSCARQPEVIVRAAQQRSSSKEIDADPWALFPPGAVCWAELAADQLFASSFGKEASALLSEHLPLSRDVGFDPATRVSAIYSAVYATAGADLVTVLRGRFDPGTMQQRFSENPTARNGKAIAKRTFAGQEMYVTDEMALSVATEQTLIFGTEIGVRRVLERIEMGKLVRSLPDWFEDMLAQPADFTLGVDLDAQPVPATIRSRLSFLEGLRAARILGNFQDPGLNLAGTLTYDRPESAVRATETMDAFGATLDKYALLFSSLKIERPLRRLETRSLGKDAQVAVEAEGRAIGLGLAQADGWLSDISQ